MKQRDSVNQFFEEDATDYLNRHYLQSMRSFMSVRHARMLQYIDKLKLAPSSCALDAGCGPGIMVADLLAKGLNVYGMDASEEMLRLARERVETICNDKKADLRKGDIEHLEYPDSFFELVVSSGVIEYLRSDAAVLREFARVIKPGGFLLTSVINALSYVNISDVIIEPLKRIIITRWLLDFLRSRVFRQGGIKARYFRVRKHLPNQFRAAVRGAGFDVLDDTFFYFMPVPRPLEHLCRSLSDSLGSRMEVLGKTRWGWLGEGYMVLCRKPYPHTGRADTNKQS